MVDHLFLVWNNISGAYGGYFSGRNHRHKFAIKLDWTGVRCRQWTGFWRRPSLVSWELLGWS